MFRKLANLFRNWITLGAGHQTFLGASWVVLVLRYVPFKRQAALRILSLSPHYFYRNANPSYAGLSHGQFIEAEFVRNQVQRQEICAKLLLPRLKSDDVALDYGCGPGFLAKAVSAHVARVVACDISRGVIAAAKIINAAPNITYQTLDPTATELLPPKAVDVIYSFAVIQHVNDAVFAQILAAWRAALKAGGRLMVHVVIDAEGWRTEAEWLQDQSLVGKARLKYGLNCFSRSESFCRSAFQGAGFRNIEILPIQSLAKLSDPDVSKQHIVFADAG